MLISSLSAKLVIKKSGVLDPIINTNISVQTDFSLDYSTLYNHS